MSKKRTVHFRPSKGPGAFCRMLRNPVLTNDWNKATCESCIKYKDKPTYWRT